MTVLNTSILYSTFIMPIYSAAASALFANPFFLLPMLGANYLIWRRSHVYFYGDRAEVVNVFLKPNGKQVMIETRDGNSKLVNNTDIYHAKSISDNHDSRVDFNYGANNYCYIRGNTIIQDSWVLDNVLNGSFIDTRNTDYDFDLSKEFTWEFRDLVEIKKRNRIVDRVMKPTIANLTKLDSGSRRAEAIKRGALVTKREAMKDFKMYEYFTDQYNDDKTAVEK